MILTFCLTRAAEKCMYCGRPFEAERVQRIEPHANKIAALVVLGCQCGETSALPFLVADPVRLTLSPAEAQLQTAADPPAEEAVNEEKPIEEVADVRE